ncbi:DENN domain containing protein Crag, partial [Dissostichus eleginoides]
SMLRALLVENKLLVSQRRAAGPWKQKCVRCWAPIRVACRFHPTARDKPAGEMERALSVSQDFNESTVETWTREFVWVVLEALG